MTKNLIDDLPSDLRKLVSGLQEQPDFARRLAELASILRERRHRNDQVFEKLARSAWEIDPHDPHVRALTDWALRKSVRPYHFPIVHDESRIRAYDQALRRLVTSDMNVLEIGTGTGVIAMMAARAGAKHVYTCESERLVADAAREVIASNRLDDRVTVIAKRSSDVVVGVDLPARADLLVHDLIADDLLAMGVLAVTEDARERLLRSNALAVPARVALRGVLMAGEPWSHSYRMEKVSGFDLTAFNRLAPPTVPYRHPGHPIENALSEEVDVLHFDFSQSHFPGEKKVVEIRAQRDGVAEGLLTWLWFELAPLIALEGKPPAPTIRRAPIMHVFRRPLTVRAGEPVALTIEHDRQSVLIWPA